MREDYYKQGIISSHAEVRKIEESTAKVPTLDDLPLEKRARKIAQNQEGPIPSASFQAQ